MMNLIKTDEVLPSKLTEVIATHMVAILPVSLFAREMENSSRKHPFLQHPCSLVQWAIIDLSLEVVVAV
jgi:hypothetical protein